jgi:hypothetical protein
MNCSHSPIERVRPDSVQPAHLKYKHRHGGRTEGGHASLNRDGGRRSLLCRTTGKRHGVNVR